MVKQAVHQQLVWEALATITDPEIPVLTLVEMKVIRSVAVADDGVVVTLAPTFVGCPALEQMKREIRTRLAAIGCERTDIEISYSPPWSTEMLDAEAREKLRAFGIAPPPKHDGEFTAVLAFPVACPFCASARTHLESAFGATLCKQIYYCDDCRQSFERFKPL